jgi:hypothetical protein
MGLSMFFPRRTWPLFALVLALCWPSSAAAFHGLNEHITDDTAWTARQGTFRFGLYKLEYSPHDRFTAGTYIWPWLLHTSSLYGKWRFYSGDTWRWAVRLGFFRLDSSAFEKSDQANAVFTVVPFELASSYRIDSDDQLSQSLVVTAVNLKGTADNDAFQGAAQGGVTNSQYVAVYEHRYSSTRALVVTGRFLLAQVARADADVVWHPDEFTTIELHGQGTDPDSLSFRAAFSIVPSFVWSWDTFNLRLGVGYGNLNIPGVNFMLPKRSLVPDVDLYWILD